MKFMITNGGAHPAEKWTSHVTGEIADLIKIEPTAAEAGAAEIDKQTFRSRVMCDLNRHFKELESGEGNLPLDRRIEQVIAEIAVAAQGTRFADHFLRPEVVLHLRDLFSRRVAAASNVYRDYDDMRSQEHLKSPGGPQPGSPLERTA